MKKLEIFDFLGGFDSIEFESDIALIQIIDLIKELNEAEYQFVMQNTFRLRNKGN